MRHDQLFDVPAVLEEVDLAQVLKTEDGGAEDAADAPADLLFQAERDKGHDDDVEEADAVLDQEEGEVVQQVDLGHVHVQRVGRHEGEGEADDEAPRVVGVLLRGVVGGRDADLVGVDLVVAGGGGGLLLHEGRPVGGDAGGVGGVVGGRVDGRGEDGVGGGDRGVVGVAEEPAEDGDDDLEKDEMRLVNLGRFEL